MSTPSLPPSSRPAPALDADKVVCAALGLLDEVGFDGLTLRRLADRLGVKAAALYWHFKNKQDLIDQMAFMILREEYPDAREQADGWRSLLGGLAHRHRHVLLAHRDGARLIAGADMAKAPFLEGLERLLAQLHGSGFSRKLALLSIINITRYTLGCVFEEQANPRPKEERMAMRREMVRKAAGKYPEMARTFSEVADLQKLTAEDRFEHGLNLMLLGVDQMLQQEKKGS